MTFIALAHPSWLHGFPGSSDTAVRGWVPLSRVGCTGSPQQERAAAQRAFLKMSGWPLLSLDWQWCPLKEGLDVTFVMGLSHFQKPQFLLWAKSCLCSGYTAWSVGFILECALAAVILIVGVWPSLRNNCGSLLSEGCAVACQQLLGKHGCHLWMVSLSKCKWETFCQVEEFSNVSVFKVTIVMLSDAARRCSNGVSRTERWHPSWWGWPGMAEQGGVPQECLCFRWGHGEPKSGCTPWWLQDVLGCAWWCLTLILVFILVIPPMKSRCPLRKIGS